MIQPHLRLISDDRLAFVLSSADDLDPSIVSVLRVHTPAPASLLPAPSPDGMAEPPPPSPRIVSLQPGSAGDLDRLPETADGEDEWRVLYRSYYRTDLEFGEALLDRMRNIAAPPGLRRPLCTPTQTGGWIEPAEAARRLWYLTDTPSSWDLALMILRLAPDSDRTALAALERLDSPEATITPDALGEGVDPGLSHLERRPAWAAAVARRDPAAYEDEVRPLASAARELVRDRRFHRLEEAEPLPDDPMSVLERYCLPSMGMLPWLTTLWPSNHEPVFRMVTRWLWHHYPGHAAPRSSQSSPFPPIPVPGPGLKPASR